MDKKRNKLTVKNMIHTKRVLKARMKECYVTGKSLKFVKLHDKYLSLS